VPKIIENRLIEEFKDRGSFSRKELFDYFKYFEPDLKEGTFGWRIYDLKNKDIIKPLKRGLYVISYKPKYKPDVSQQIIKLAKKITERFDEVKYCIWETEWLNEFSQHQAGRRIILVEIEKEFVESLYFELKDSFRNDLYLNPDAKVIDFYIAESNYPVIIKKLITRSPTSQRTQNRIKFYIPQLEKILVDIFVEDKMFYFYQGSELMHIYENAISNYTINFTKLFGYASRRGREHEIKLFLAQNMNHLIEEIIND
jgi:hypothetical protein